MNAQLLSKDSIKETLAGLRVASVAMCTLEAIAMDTVGTLATQASGIVVLESVWLRRDLLHGEAGFATTRQPLAWWDAAPEIATAATSAGTVTSYAKMLASCCGLGPVGSDRLSRSRYADGSG